MLDEFMKFFGAEILDRRALCVYNLLLHDVDTQICSKQTERERERERQRDNSIVAFECVDVTVSELYWVLPMVELCLRLAPIVFVLRIRHHLIF